MPLLLRGAAEYVTHMFRVFGLVDAVLPIGFGMEASPGGGAGAGGDGAAGGGGGGGGEASREATLAPFLDAISGFREQVRALARTGDTKALLALCDSLRDDVMAPLGVKLEDGAAAAAAADGAAAATGTAAAAAAGSRWKLRSPAELQREIEARRAAAEARAGAKAEAAAEAARKNAEKEAKAALDAGLMFREGEAAAAFSAWDAEGVPTHDKAGAELGKGEKKRLRKEWELQKKLNDWLAARRAGGAATAE